MKFRPLIKKMNFELINKVFGNLYYDKKETSKIKLNFQIKELEESIFKTEQ